MSGLLSHWSNTIFPQRSKCATNTKHDSRWWRHGQVSTGTVCLWTCNARPRGKKSSCRTTPKTMSVQISSSFSSPHFLHTTTSPQISTRHVKTQTAVKDMKANKKNVKKKKKSKKQKAAEAAAKAKAKAEAKVLWDWFFLFFFEGSAMFLKSDTLRKENECTPLRRWMFRLKKQKSSPSDLVTRPRSSWLWRLVFTKNSTP